MNKKSKIIPFSILTMLLVIGSGVLSSCSTPSTSVEPTTITTTTPVIEVSSVTLDITKVSLEVEATKQLTATVLPVTATVKTIAWSTSDKAIASVSDAGLVTALKAGTATISAKAGSKTATCVVTVTPKIIAVESISLDKTSISLEELATQKLVASILPTDATDKTVIWTSSAEEIATVVDGLVTAKKTGTATITAKAGSATAICEVIVTAPTAGTITVTGAKELYATGEYMVVSLEVTMSNGTKVNYADVNLTKGVNIPKGVTITGFDTSTVGKKSGTITIDSKTSTINYVVYKAVDSEATLRALVESTTGKTPIVIGLTKDITIATRYNVARPFILYGITSEADKNISINTTADTRVFNFDASVSGCESLLNSSIEFHNITMEVDRAEESLRANSFWGCGAIKVVYDNTILKSSNYYALNISEENDGAHFTIKNKSVISGWTAINLHSSNTIFDIENSTLIGTNNNAGPTDHFSTIVVGEPFSTYKVENNVINVKDSTINAIANTDAYQYCIDLRNESAKVNFSGANSVSTVKKNDTNKTPCYIRGFALTQIVGIDLVTTTDVPELKMFMTRAEVDAVIAGK